MKVLLLGYSDIARRRVLPALRSLGVESVDIASEAAVSVEWSGAVSARLFRDYDVALRQTDAEVVYVSTVNSHHAQWTRKALRAGFHVAVDKPAFLSIGETQDLIELAESKQLCLAEATVYSYHPRIAMARQVFEQSGSAATHLLAAFSFPLAAPNFRYRPELGGGALWDLGPYAVTAGRLFFGERPTGIVASNLSASDQVDTSFSMMAVYPGGRSCVGSFGFTTGYMNRLDIMGPGTVVTIDRVFSPPPNVPTELTIRQMDQVRTILVPPADSFALFFNDFFENVSGQNHSDFLKRMLADAQAIDRLRASALNAHRAGSQAHETQSFAD